MTVASKSSSLAVGICFPVIGLILTSIRIYSRRRKNTKIAIDDWFAIVAWFFVTGACATLIVGLYNGAFFFTDENDDAAVARHEHALAQITGAVPMLWFFANASVKYSILFFYRRIFMGKGINVVTWILIVSTTIWLIYSIIAAILYCGTHVRENFEGPWTDCPEWANSLQFVTFVGDAVLSFVTLVVPIPYLLRLQMEPAKKLALIIVFGLGGLAFIAGLLNCIYQFLLKTDPTSTFGVAGTPTTSNTDGFLITMNWPVIEAGTGLIACNLPSLSGWFTNFASTYLSMGSRLLSTGVRRLSQYSRNIRSTLSRRSSSRHPSVTDTLESGGAGGDLKVIPLNTIKTQSNTSVSSGGNTLS